MGLSALKTLTSQSGSMETVWVRVHSGLWYQISGGRCWRMGIFEGRSYSFDLCGGHHTDLSRLFLLALSDSSGSGTPELP